MHGLDGVEDIRQLRSNDADLMDAVLCFFGEAFGDPESYTTKRPSADYLRKLLGGDSFIALAAFDDGARTGTITGALCAYELRKFEQERSEIHIYDLAVAARDRHWADQVAPGDRRRAWGLGHLCTGRYPARG
ncbi:MAG: Acetyltransferase, family [Massilia sp.]|nr:Acetyltransferase, family [Massilia sp.]